MSPTPESTAFLQILRDDGIVKSVDARLIPLSGGVSSEIYRVEDGGDVFIVKRALSKLRVKDDWFVDVGRNRYEQLYLSYVAKFLPMAVPSIRNSHPDHGYFAMEFLGAEFANWKQLLLDGTIDVRHAELAGQILGTIHAHSAGDAHAAETFATTSNFHQLRVDPYLLTTGRRHPRLQPVIEREADRLEQSRICLVHGDFSPKNILIGPDRLVLLDCEVAWYGDPAFDAAFLLNHLFLKSLVHIQRALVMEPMIVSFWKSYTAACESAFDIAALEVRVARLLLMLMLARIDGKSPAEYLTDENLRQFVRDFVYATMLDSDFNLQFLRRTWFNSLSPDD